MRPVVSYYDEKRTHSGKYCFGKTPMETFIDSLPLAREKKLDDSLQATIEQNNIVCQMKQGLIQLKLKRG